MNNERNYKRFWLAIIIVAAVTAVLTGCTPTADLSEARYFPGGCFTENDSIVGIDTVYTWSK